MLNEITLLIVSLLTGLLSLPLIGQDFFEYNLVSSADEEIEIPFTYQGGFIIVEAKLNISQTVNLILDTGAENLILFDKSIIEELNLVVDKEIEILGSDLETKVDALICRNILLSLNNTANVIRDIIVLEDDFLALEQSVGIPIDGLLGGRSFWGLVLTIDYEKQIVKLTHKNSFKPDAVHQVLDLEIENQKPYLEAACTNHRGEHIDLKLLLDTGSSLGLMLFTQTDSLLHLNENYLKGILGKGLGGDIYGYVGRLPSLQIGELDTFHQVINYYQSLEQGINMLTTNGRNGLLGNPILSRYEMTIDYYDSKLYLKPNKHFKETFKFDLSGMQLLATGAKLDKFKVRSVYANSPADQADIRHNDEIIRIGHWPRFMISLPWLTDKLMKREGKTVRVVLSRDGKKLVKKLTLRDYL